MSIRNEMSIQNILDRKMSISNEMSICVKKSMILDDLCLVEYMRSLASGGFSLANIYSKFLFFNLAKICVVLGLSNIVSLIVKGKFPVRIDKKVF